MANRTVASSEFHGSADIVGQIDFSLFSQIISSNNTLSIFDASPGDSATYTCEADNGYGRASDSATVTVENVYVAQTCEDNPHFANCKLIVRAQYCTNK